MKASLSYSNLIFNHFSFRLAWLKMILLLLILTGIRPKMQAQMKEWDKTIGGNEVDRLTALVASPDGGYLLGGWSNSYKGGDKTENPTYAGRTHYWVVKIDATGKKLWDNTIGGYGGERLTALITTPDGGYLLGGSSASNAYRDKSENEKGGNNGNSDYWVVKIDGTGKKIWDKTLGGSEIDQLTAMVAAPKGGYLLGGLSISGISGDKSESNRGDPNSTYVDYWVVKIDENGNKIWDKTIGGNGIDELSALVANSDGGFLLSGYSSSAASGDKSQDNKGVADKNGNRRADYWVVKIDGSGKKIWDKTLGGDGWEILTTSVATADGGYLLGGSSDSEASGDKSESNKGEGSYRKNYWVVKINATGQKVWDKTIGGSGGESLTALITTLDGGYLLGGKTGSKAYADKSENSKGSHDYWVVKIDGTGKKMWDKTLGGSRGDELAAMVATPNGGYLLGGSSLSGISGDKSEKNDSQHQPDYWVIKLKDDIKDSKLSVFHLQNSGNAIQRTSLNYQTTGTIKIAADYTDGTLFKITRPNSQHLRLKILENATNVKSGEPSDATGYMSSVKSYSDSIVAIYRHPALSQPTLLRILHLQLVDVSDPAKEITLATYPIKVVQPPLMLVHGLWSKGAEAFPGLKARLIAAGLFENEDQIRYADYGNDLFFANNALKFINHKNALLKAYADNNISASKIDIIAHSMGGLLSRQYIQDNAAYQQDVNKLITLNTPHSGSPMANFINLLPPVAIAALTVAEHNPENGAVEDLRYNGPAIEKLNTNPDTKGVAIHALTTNITLSPTLPLQQLLNGNLSYGGFLAGWVALTRPGAAVDINNYLSKSVFQGDYDLVVGLNSQRGGLAENSGFTTNFKGQWHGSGGTPAVQNKMVALLRESNNRSTSKSFSTGGFHPPKITSVFQAPPYQASLNAAASGATATSTIKILTPTRNTLLKDVDSINVKVNASAGVTRILLMCGTGTPELTTRLIDGASGSTYIRVPKGSLGCLHLTAFAFASTNYVQFDTLSTRVGTNATLKSIRVNPRLVSTPQNDSTLISIMGTYSNGIERNITGLPSLTIAFAKKRARLGKSGWVVGLSTGIDTLRVTYQGKTDEVRVEVTEPTSNPKKPAIASFTPTSGPVGTMVTVQGTNFTGTTAVAFNNKAAPGFTVNPAGTSLKVPVPVGAVTGPITLTTPGGTAASATNFTVTSGWNWRYGGTGHEGFTAIIKTSDGGYLAGGYSNSGVSGDKTQASQGKNDYWIVKLDKNGKKLWDKRYGGSADDYLNTLVQTPDGGYLLAGSSLSGSSGDKTQTNRGDRDYWVIKISSTGVKQWDKGFGGSGTDELKKVVLLNSGNLLLAGNSNSPASGDKSQPSRGSQDYWLVMINKTGTKLWDKRYGGTSDENLEGLAATLNGDFLLGGSSLSGIGGDKTQASWGGSDYWLVRVNGSGNKVWDKRFGGTGEDNLMDLGSTNTSTGNFFIAGHSTSGLSGDKSQTSQGGKDFWMLKINGNGDKLWDKRFGGSGHEGLRSILLTPDGGYLLSGRSESGISGDKTQSSRGGSDYWVVKTSSTGVKQWDKRFGGTGYEEIRTVLPVSDGGFLLGGRSDSGVSGDRTQPGQGGVDYWLVKVAPESLPLIAAREATVAEETTNAKDQISLQAYPNPFTQKATISFKLTETQPVTLKVYDSQSREVATLFQGEAQANQVYEVEWQASNKATGMYLLQLQTPTQRRQQKLLLTR